MRIMFMTKCSSCNMQSLYKIVDFIKGVTCDLCETRTLRITGVYFEVKDNYMLWRF